MIQRRDESDQWMTPDHIIRRVLDIFDGVIDLDPCSNSRTRPNIPARQLYTVEDDGLAQVWQGSVYFNPPYRTARLWVAKLVGEFQARRVTRAIGLLPARTDTDWYRLLRDFPRVEVDGRLVFKGPDLRPSKGPGKFPSAIFGLGVDPWRFEKTFGDLGDVYIRVGKITDYLESML